MGSGENSRRTL